MNEEVKAKKSDSFGRSWRITKSTWRILSLDKEMLAIPLISGVLGIVMVIVGYAGSLLLSPKVLHHSGFSSWSYDSNGGMSHATYAGWIVTSALLALLSSYTLAAILAMSLKRLRGGDPTLRDGFGAVKSHFKALTIFTLISFGIIQILQRLEANLPFAGKLLAFLGDIAWRVGSFFALPVIVDADNFVGPIDATRQSVSLIRRSWKESTVNQFTLGSVFFIILLLELAIGILVTTVGGRVLGVGAGAGAAILMLLSILLTILVSSAMDGIAKAVLYYYALTGEAPEQFDQRLLKEAFTPKKATKIFAH